MNLSSDLLDAIKNQTYNLKPVKVIQKKRRQSSPPEDFNIAKILARRIAMGYGNIEEDNKSIKSVDSNNSVRSIMSWGNIKRTGSIISSGSIKRAESIISSERIKRTESIMSSGSIKRTGSIISSGCIKSTESIMSSGSIKSTGSPMRSESTKRGVPIQNIVNNDGSNSIVQNINTGSIKSYGSFKSSGINKDTAGHKRSGSIR